jgi:hypothetical protein
MAKAGTEKPKTPKPKSKKEQYERFKETAREHGCDDPESAKAFEENFRKVVPPRIKGKQTEAPLN